MSSQDIIDIEAERSKHSLKALGVDVDAIYGEMSSLGIKIDLSITPDVMYINGKMVAVREASLQAQRIYLRIQRAIGDSQSWLLNLETSFDILSSSKLEYDAEVRAGQSIDDRKAIVNNKLVDYKRAIKEAKNNVSLLKALNKAIDLCIKNIDRSDADVKQQARLMESQMRNLKSSDVSAAMRDSNLRRTEEDMQSMDKLFDDSLQGSSATVAVGTEDSADLEVSLEEDLPTVTCEEINPAEETAVEAPDAEPAHASEPVRSDGLAGADFDDDCVSLAPGLTGVPDACPMWEEVTPEVAVIVEEPMEGEPDLLSMLDSIPTVDKGGMSSTKEDLLGDADDCFGLDLGDLVGDPEAPEVAVVSSTDDDDVFSGLVESSVVTEQKVPKIIREAEKAPAAAVGTTKAKPSKAPEAATLKASAAKPAVAQTSMPAGAPTAPVAPAKQPTALPSEEQLSLDDLLLDLGV